MLLYEFHAKMNAIDDNMGQILLEGVTLLNEGNFEGMVIGNQADHFCAGANIFVILGEAMQENWKAVEDAVHGFQQINHRAFIAGHKVHLAEVGQDSPRLV
ncbi:MAG: hypothetical protein M5U34_47835, partial [Chloroflexi bacterium]|nr:hypothetical protein [Chloroflexota bacterium]